MGTYNHNNSGDKNCQNRDALYYALMAVLLMSNGVTVGGALNLYLGGAQIFSVPRCAVVIFKN